MVIIRGQMDMPIGVEIKGNYAVTRYIAVVALLLYSPVPLLPVTVERWGRLR